MCGIAGYWGRGSSEILSDMGRAIAHRGPDDEGTALVDDIGFVHRRLSIIDLSPAGHQPMYSEDGSVVLVFNGEIYNFLELKQTYLQGCRFRGGSDTEVLLRLYEKQGVSFLEHIRGMFAVALYDRRTKKLILARDPVGKKPLYWTANNGLFVFGSEIKAILRHPGVTKSLDHDALAKYLVYEYIPGPQSIFDGIHKLEPGHVLDYDGENIHSSAFENLHPNQGRYGGSFFDAKADFEVLFSDALKKRMVADVPVGVFLSGGLDSSMVAYYAARTSKTRIKTFSVGFTDTAFDESKYAREVSHLLDTEHHEFKVEPNNLLAAVQDIPNVLDEPMADSSIIPSLLLSSFTKSHVTVALGGDGADELFLGYDTFFAHKIGMFYEHIPLAIHRMLNSIVSNLPVSHAYMSFDFKAKKFLSGFGHPPMLRNTLWMSAFTPSELQLIMHEVPTEEVLFTSALRSYTDGKNGWDNLVSDYLKGYLLEDILVKVDRASMFSGLEVRSPFLDLEVVKFALNLPVHYKLHGRKQKYILKELMRSKLPDHIINRTKHGFNMPIGSWIRSDLKEFFHDVLLNGALVRSGLFKREGLAILLESHIVGTVDNRKKLWSLLVLGLWMEKWYE